MSKIERKALELVNSTFLEPYYKDWAQVPQGCLSNALIRAIEERETLSAENERLIKAGDGDVGLIHWQGERIEKLEAALREIARLRTDLSGDFSIGSKQSDIARAALGETE